jgi:hypothetical protein
VGMRGGARSGRSRGLRLGGWCGVKSTWIEIFDTPRTELKLLTSPRTYASIVFSHLYFVLHSLLLGPGTRITFTPRDILWSAFC